MLCEKYRDLFDPFFDKEIKDSQKSKLLSHLDECSPCALEFKAYSKMLESVENMEEADAPSDLTDLVMKGLRATDKPWQDGVVPAAPRQYGWVWAGTFSVALVAILLTFVDLKPDQPVQAQRPVVPPRGYQDEAPQLAPERAVDDLTAAVPASRAVPVDSGLGIHLVRHQGPVEVLDQTTNEWKAVTGEMQLALGDRVRTGDEGVAGLEYEKEKVALRLKPRTVIQVLDRQTLRVFAGQAWVLVRKKGTQFRAETPNAIASVRGTKFSVEVTPLSDLYGNKARHVLKLWGTDDQKSHPFPRPVANLGVYSVHVGVDLMQQLAAAALASQVESQVKVYESVVNVVQKDERGREVSNRDVSEGFKTGVTLAMLGKSQILSQDDFTNWQGVMVFDQDVISRAQAQLDRAASAGSGTVRPTGAGVATGTGVAQPVSESGPSGAFDDIHRR